MAFPINPTDGQTTVVNGITYTYSTALTAWGVTSSGAALTVATNVSAQGNVTGSGMYANTFTATGNVAGGNLVLTGTLESGAQNVTGNVDVTGNINVTGNLNYSNVQQLIIGDPIIYVGADNTGNVYDLGMVVSYNDGTYQHGGLVRDASDGTWKLFGNVIPEPTTVVDFTNAIYQPMLAGAISSTGTVTSAGLLASGIISASGNVTGANFTSGGNISVVGNIAAAGLTLNSGIFTTTLAAGTLQNTRINPRVVSTTSASTITINSDITDQYNVTALATAATIAAPTGTPVDGQKLTLRLLDNGTSQALSWNPIFIEIGSTLPTVTVPSKFLYIGCIYNAESVSWDVVSVAQEI